MDVTFERTVKRRYAVIVERPGGPTLIMHPAPGFIEIPARSGRAVDGLSARRSALAIGEAMTLAWHPARTREGRRRG